MAQFRSQLFAHHPDFGPIFADLEDELANEISNNHHIRSFVSQVRQAPNDASMLREAAQCFSAANLKSYAVDCYVRITELGLLTASDTFSLARELFALGEVEAASSLLLANVAARTSDEILLIAGMLCDAGLHRQALALLVLRVARMPENFQYLRLLSFALGQCSRHSVAIRVAQLALECEPGDRETNVFVASQLAARGGHEGAAAILMNLPDRNATENELAASVLLTLGRREDALREINEALATQPGWAPYLAMRAMILSAMHRLEEAAVDIIEAQRLRPDDESINRSGFVIATEAGDYNAALRLGAWLVARFPDEEAIGQTLKIVMERRDRQRLLSRIDGESSEPALASPDRARERARADQVNPLAQQGRIILALILRETKTRFGRARFGYLWVLFEPLAHIGIMITLITLFSHSSLPPVGTNFALFYFTGIIPFHLFTHTISHMINSVPENRPLLQLPLVRTFDVFVARGALELVTELSVAAILILGFYCIGLFTPPDNVAGIALAMALIWATAFGLGLLFSVVNAFFPGFERIWGAFSSILYFTSGTFYIPRMMPESIRDVLAWNPVLQAIELIRSSYFYTPFPFWLDVRYMYACAFGALAAGLVAQRAFRAKLMETE